MATLITQKKPVALTGAEGGGDRDYNHHKHRLSSADLGQAAPTLSVKLDSISDSPDEGRTRDVGCAGECSYTPAAGAPSGAVSLLASHGGSSDELTVQVRSPTTVRLSVDDATLSAVG